MIGNSGAVPVLACACQAPKGAGHLLKPQGFRFKFGGLSQSQRAYRRIAVVAVAPKRHQLLDLRHGKTQRTGRGRNFRRLMWSAE